MKKLSELYPDYTLDDVAVNGIKINSKEVVPDDIFVCTTGVTADRHDFIDEAIKNGASSIVVSKKVDYDIPTIMVDDTNKELPLLASRFYDYPEKNLDIIGITGTNGKTTVATIIQELLGDDICGYLGTNGIICSKFNEQIKNTTPDADRLYGYLRRFVDSGCKYLSMETSSEAFYRKRLSNLKFKIGVVTNVTEDHLNIHKTIDNYVSCKMELVKQVRDDGYSILNADDKYYSEFRSVSRGKILTYGKNDSSLQIIDIKLSIKKTDVTLKYQNKLYSFSYSLLGEFNVYNLCGAILTLIALGYSIDGIIKRVDRIKAPNGRVQFLDFGQKFDIILDYAHTTDAFSKIYELLDKVKKGRLITVTGSAGGREKEKRPIMGNLVLLKSDYVIFTMDDPRYEKVEDIVKDLTSLSDKNNYEIIVDRKSAIARAFDLAESGDIVLVAGKGIDNYMAIGDKYLPYCDLEVIKNYFNSL